MLVGGYVFIEKALEKIKQNQPPLPSQGLTRFQVGARAADSSNAQVPESLPRSEHLLAAGPLGWVISFAPTFTAEQILDHLILLGAGPPVLQPIALHRSRMLLL